MDDSYVVAYRLGATSQSETTKRAFFYSLLLPSLYVFLYYPWTIPTTVREGVLLSTLSLVLFGFRGPWGACAVHQSSLLPPATRAEPSTLPATLSGTNGRGQKSEKKKLNPSKTLHRFRPRVTGRNTGRTPCRLPALLI